MSDANDYTVLKDLEWIKIPGIDFIIKYKFFGEGYSILVTNLKAIFGENMAENEVQRRFSNLNVHAKMKTSVIIRNLERSLDMTLAGNDSFSEVDCFEKTIGIHVRFNVNRASLSFDFELQRLSLHQLRSYIIVPTLSHALVTYQENVALKKRISQLESKLKLESVSKDSFLDYKKNLNAFNLMRNSNVSETIILDSFLNVQRDLQACFSDREKVIALHQNRPPENSDKSHTPIKKEISEPSLPIQYEEDKEENVEGDGKVVSCPSLLQLPVKREISESPSLSPNEEENIANTFSQAPSLVKHERSKKKKNFKF